MRFQMPETLDGLSADKLKELLAAATAEATELNAIADDKITAEESSALIELVGHIDAIASRSEQVAADAEAAAAALADARAAIAGRAESAAEGEAAAAAEAEAAQAAEAAAEVEVAQVEERELVAANAAGQSFAARAAAQAAPPKAPEAPEVPEGALSLTASANVPGFESGQELDFNELAKAFLSRGKSFAGGGSKGRGTPKPFEAGVHQLPASAQRFSVARFTKAETEFTISEKMSAEAQFELIQRVAQESRLPGGSLVAAGGWCAPSEQIWSFCELETMDGLLSIPEMVARRGGVTWTPGPQLSDLLSDEDFGFIQTETEAEAGETKPCFDITCPDWDEVRLDAIGFCIRAGLLTNSAYPELVRRFLQLGLIAHARRVNATTISRISTAIGAATVFTPVTGDGYSATSDVLAAAELNAIRIRETHAMAENASVEAIFPIWALAPLRSELSRRTGVDMMNVTNAMLISWFRERKVNPQFVRDYQSISSAAASTAGGTAGWTRFPDSLEFMMYPAGAFVRLGTDVIDLDAIYDSTQLATNTYTAAFFEEGIAILNACGTGVKVQVAIDNLNGATGFPAIGAGEGVTIPAVEAP